MFDAGYNVSSRFYEESTSRPGMRLKQYRDGRRDVRIRFAVGESWLGAVLVAVPDEGVCAIDLGDDAETLLTDFQDCFPRAELVGDDADFEQIIASVIGHLERPEGNPDHPPLDINGSAFQ